MRVISTTEDSGHGKEAATDAEKQSLNAREGQRSAKLNGRAATLLRGDLNGAF